MASLVSERWDTTVQTPHGGQEWRDIEGYVEDFSVTTNPLGPPPKPLAAAAAVVSDIGHYPPSDYEPARSELFNYLFPKCKDQSLSQRLLLGNGASELIELCVRTADEWRPSDVSTRQRKWRQGPFQVQYQEYRRAAEALGRTRAEPDDQSADLLCIVNPCNPTGEFMGVESMKEYIVDKCCSGTTVLVDESMMPFKGFNWLEESLLSQYDWVTEMGKCQNIFIFVIQSWTKFFACPGLRIGSAFCPSLDSAHRLKQLQVPWSLNTLALTFLEHAVKDSEYMAETYKVIPEWRLSIVTAIKGIASEWAIKGVEWQPFIWINTHSEQTARDLVARCKASGVPIRWGGLGYDCPSFIRVGVRLPAHAAILIRAVKSAFEQK